MPASALSHTRIVSHAAFAMSQLLRCNCQRTQVFVSKCRAEAGKKKVTAALQTRQINHETRGRRGFLHRARL